MKKQEVLPPIVLGIVGLSLWEFSCRFFDMPTYLLPKPSDVVREVADNFGSLSFNAVVTVIEAVFGFFLANALAIGASVCMVYVRYMDRALMPFAIALKTTPIVALAPLLLLWLGSGMAPKIASAALICFFPALVNSLKGLYSFDEGEEDLFRVYGASKTKMLTKLRFWRAAPYIFAALKISSSLAIVGAIVGEFVGANKGIGYVILISSYHLETPKMFAALFFASVSGLLFYAFIAAIDRRVVFWSIDDIDTRAAGLRRRQSRPSSSPRL